MDTTASTVNDITALVVEVLGLGERASSMTASTGLLGSLPELDSMAVVELVTTIEERLGVTLDEADISADVFETIGTLAAFVDQQRG